MNHHKPCPRELETAADLGRTQKGLDNPGAAEGRLLLSLRYLRTGKRPIFGDLTDPNRDYFAVRVRASVIFDAAGLCMTLEKYYPQHAPEIHAAYITLYASVLTGTSTPEADPLLDLRGSWWTET